MKDNKPTEAEIYPNWSSTTYKVLLAYMFNAVVWSPEKREYVYGRRRRHSRIAAIAYGLKAWSQVRYTTMIRAWLDYEDYEWLQCCYVVATTNQTKSLTYHVLYGRPTNLVSDCDDYVLPRQRLWMFDVLVCLSTPQSVSCRSRSSMKVFHRTSLPLPLFPSSALVLNHISSHFLIPLSDSSLVCTVDAIIDFTFNIWHFVITT